MKNYQMLIPAVLLGLGVATTASAQTTTTTTTPAVGMNNPAAPDNNMKAAAPNTFSGWMTDYSKAHDGRISRQAYMDEAGKRWDTADKTNQGLTNDQIYGLYGTSAGTNNSLNKDNKAK